MIVAYIDVNVYWCIVSLNDIALWLVVAQVLC